MYQRLTSRVYENPPSEVFTLTALLMSLLFIQFLLYKTSPAVQYADLVWFFVDREGDIFYTILLEGEQMLIVYRQNFL